MDVEKYLDKRTKNYKKAIADHSVKEATIGEHVIKLIKSHKNISIQNLLNSLQEEASSTTNELLKLRAEAALNHLRSFLPQSESL